jgi:hypothetical protein
MTGAGGEAFPLRPLTVGEVLDAATNLLRRYAVPLLGTALALAVVEQLLLYPLRRAANVAPPWYYPPHFDRLGTYWVLLAAGFGTEGVILTLLGGLAARAAVADLLGRSPGRLIGRATRPGRLSALALLVGAAASLGAAGGLLPWLLWYMFTGLAGPALIVDRRAATGPAGPTADTFRALGPLGALGRSMGLVGRSGWRPGRIRVLGYLAWWVIRLALGAGGWSLVTRFLGDYSPFFGDPVPAWAWPAAMATWAIVDALAYATLGCLDAVLHLETRMRVEGLDIAVSRALRTDRPVEPALAVPR